MHSYTEINLEFYNKKDTEDACKYYPANVSLSLLSSIYIDIQQQQYTHTYIYIYIYSAVVAAAAAANAAVIMITVF